MFVDETKARGYTVAAAVFADAELNRARRRLEDLRLSGQKRIHFVKENNSRRRLILSELAALGTKAYLYHVDGQDAATSRHLCLEALVKDAAESGAERIVLELDEQIRRQDERSLHLATHRLGVEVRYSHEQASAEPLLWAADAVAWSYSKGSDWSRRIKPMVIAARLLLP